MLLLIGLTMVFLHIIADFLVQNDVLIKLKQKKTWEEYNESGRYTYDYIPALLAHSFSWAFITFLPLLYYKNIILYCITIIVNTVIHAYIDDLKCNKFKINLIEDQLFHLIQISMTLFISVFILKYI